MSDIKTLNGYNLVDTAATAKLNSVIETVGGDTLTWDGDTTGKVSVELMEGVAIYKISDNVLSLSEFANGCGLSMSTGDALDLAAEDCAFGNDEGSLVINIAELVFIALQDGATGSGLTFPEKGIYFQENAAIYVSSLTIPGYTGFTKEIIKQDALPDSVNDWNQMQNKPFYTEQVKSTVLNETTLQVDPDMGSFVVPYDEPLEDGGTYVVNYNGTEYNAVARSATIDGTTAIVIGNSDFIDGMPDNDEPFSIALFVENDEKVMMMMDLNGATEATVSIRGDFERVKKIDDKFINTPTHTIFYVDVTDSVSNPYLYHDTELTTKVTSDELFEAVLHGSLMIMHCYTAAKQVYYPLRTFNLYVEICLEPLDSNRRPSYTKFYTAEYTGT